MKKMRNEDLNPITYNSLKRFEDLKEGNRLLSIYLKRWLDVKSKSFPNYVSYSFDDEGNLWTRDYLGDNTWNRTDYVHVPQELN